MNSLLERNICEFKQYIIDDNNKTFCKYKRRTTGLEGRRGKTKRHNVFCSGDQFESVTMGGTGTPSRLH